MRLIVEHSIRSIHLIAATVWFGGVAFSTLVAYPILGKHFPSLNMLEIHNRIRHIMRITINIILLTGGIVIFIVAWNNDMKFEVEYMLYSATKLAAFGLMALFWGLFSSLYRKHLEVSDPNINTNAPRHINIYGHLTLFSGLIVFVLALLLRN